MIIGCGYVGLPLGRAFAREGCAVYGTTRSRDRIPLLEKSGLQPVVIDLLKPPFLFPAADLVYFLVAGSHDETLPQGMSNAIAALAANPPQKFIYSSSTAVYGDHQGEWIDETSPRRAGHPAGLRLVRTENILSDAVRNLRFPGIITRLSGIYGPGRIPGKESVAKGGPLKGNPRSYLNLIHLEDLINLLMETARQGREGECYLFSDDQPVRREEYYHFLAECLGLAPFSPAWTAGEDRSDSRRCSNRKIKETFKVALNYPSYRKGLAVLLSGASGRPHS